MEIRVHYREVYGCGRYYPVSDDARRVATLANRKTLSVEILQELAQAGAAVSEVYGRAFVDWYGSPLFTTTREG